MLKRFVKRLLSCLLLAALFVLVIIGGTLGVQGWRLYRATASQKPIASLYDEISSRPGFASCDQLPQTYIDAVISVEDSRFERHHGIDPAAIVRALWADLRTRSLAEGGSTLTQQLAKNELFTQEKQMARKAADERDAGDEGSRRGDVHIQRGKADADSQRIDAGGEGLHHHQLIAERAAHGARLRRAQLLDGVPDHFAADEAQQDEGNPVVDGRDERSEGLA